MALSDWKSMYAVSVTAGSGAGVGYQHNLYLNYGNGGNNGANLYFNGECKTDFTDVRVLSAAGLFLPITLKNVIAGVSATLVFKDTADCDVAHTVYVPFNNSSATDVSDDAAVFVDSISGVVGAWLMNEAVATDAVVDYSGNGNDGTPTGTTVADGKFAGTNARLFNGTSDLIRVTDDNALDITQGTVMAWVKPTNINKYQKIISKYGADPYAGVYRIRIESGNYLNSIVYVGGVAKVHDTGISEKVSAGTWTHITLVHNGTTLTQYYNGAVSVTAATAAAGNIAVSAEDLVFGRREDAGAPQWLDSALCCALIFNVPLTAEEIGNIADYYGDASLEAGKVLVRKWATTTLPTLNAATTTTQPYPTVDLTVGRKRLEKRAKQRALISIIKEYLEFKQEQRQKN